MSNNLLVVQARPEQVAIDPARAAVIVVDMQNDFGTPGGMFDRAGFDLRRSRAAIAPTAQVVETARAAGMRVVYLKMAFKGDLSDIGPTGAPNADRHRRFGVGQSLEAPDGSEGRFLVRDTWNTQVIDELAPGPEDLQIYKHRFSGFFETDLDATLKGLGITDLVFAGWTTSVCVESTLRDAMFRDYRCLLLEDCTAEPIGDEFSRSNHEASLLVVESLLGWVAKSADLLAAFETRGDEMLAPPA